MKNLTSNLIL